MTNNRWPRIAHPAALPAAALLCGLMASSFASPGAQAQGRGQSPPRDVRPAPTRPRDPAAAQQAVVVGKGSITGTVTVSGTGQPARRARVNLNGSDGAGSQTATTDDAGRFAFSGLPEGRYSLSASKPGYLGASFGQRIPGRSGTPIQLADGQRMQAQLQIWRGGVITGTVLDEHGEAIPNTPVRLLRYVLQGGQRTLQQSGNGQTDDRGIYRIFGLQPGEYLVSATPRNNSAQVLIAEQRAAVESAMQRAAAVAASNPEQAQVLAMRAERLGANLPAPDDEQPTGYAPVYYPGTTNPSSAIAVVLAPSEEKAGIDFQYQVVPVARIDGVVASTGVPLPNNVQITLVNRGFSVPGLNPGSARSDAQGTFRIPNVPPGQYTLVARATITAGREGGPAGRGLLAGGRGQELIARGRAAAGPPTDQTRLWGSADVTVDGGNVSNIVVTLQPGVPVSGRIVFDGATPPPANMSSLRVSLQPIVTPGSGPEMATGATGRVEADGKFTISSVVPGRYRLSASGATGWVVAASALDGQDAFEFPAEIKGSVGSATVTFIDRPSELGGTVTNSQSQPIPDYTLVLFPADQRYRTAFSRRILSTRPATDGRFSFRNVPAGEYRLAAVLDPEPGSWFDPAFLQQLDGSAVRVSIAEGEKKEQNLQIPGGG
jgi:Carboxypeptidase regulatory-like domain